jgi:hypothetical protein
MTFSQSCASISAAFIAKKSRLLGMIAAVSFSVISTGAPLLSCESKKRGRSGEICSRMEVNYRPQPDVSTQFTLSGAEWARHDKKSGHSELSPQSALAYRGSSLFI